MINFMKSNQNKQNLINPENAVLVIPILIGFLTSFAIGLIGFRPLLLRSNQYLETWKSFEIKKNNLVAKANELKLVNSKLRQVENQKTFLIQLIAGTKDLKALFAILNKVANQNNISLIEIEPYQTKKHIKEVKSIDPYNDLDSFNDLEEPYFNADEQSDRKESANDPLITKEIEQHNALISIKGYFYQINNFLRDLESLENIIVAKGIDLRKSEDKQNQNSKKPILLNFKTVFSAYGLAINEDFDKQ